jgi:hypothetical protein
MKDRKTIKGGWFRMPHAALDDPRFILLPPMARLMFVYLLKYRSRSNAKVKHLPGWIQLSDKELAGRLYCSTQTVFLSRRRLLVNGFINCQTTKNRKAMRYYIYDEPVRFLPLAE